MSILLDQRIPHVRLARPDSDRTKVIESCFPGTREEVLRKVFDWVDTQATAPVYRMNGLAGIGKSTIARTVVEQAEEEGMIVCGFFFARGDNELSSAGKVFPTLAYQLAQKLQPYMHKLENVVKADADVAYLEILKQFKKLIREPLNAVENGRTVLFVLDALDECSDASKAKQLLSSLLSNMHAGSKPVRVLITSRPEYHIRSVLRQYDSSTYQKCILHDRGRCCGGRH